MSKNEVNYTPWEVSQWKNLVNRLSEKKGKQMLTDKILLILTGRHQCVCAGVWVRIWLSCFLSTGWQGFRELKYLDQRMKCISPLGLTTHIPFIRLSWIQYGQKPQGPTEEKSVPWSWNVYLSKAKVEAPQITNKRQIFSPTPSQPSPSTGSLSKKTCFTDALTKLHWIWLTYGLPAVSGSREKKSSPNQDPKSFFLKGTLERWQKDREGRSKFLKPWVTTRLRNFSLLTLVILAKATFQDVSLFKSTKVLTSCLTLAFSWETGRVIHVFLSPWPFFVSRLSQQFERGLR